MFCSFPHVSQVEANKESKKTEPGALKDTLASMVVRINDITVLEVFEEISRARNFSKFEVV